MPTENNPPNEAQPPAAEAAAEEAVAPNEQRRVWNSGDLLGQETEAPILHRGQTYRLRCTRQGKLILYK